MDNNPHRPGFFPGPAFQEHHGPGSTLGWVIFALQLLMLAGLAVLIARAFMGPRFRGKGRPGHGPGDPFEIARIRYARGEVSREQYLEIVGDLGGAVSPGS
jgi:uncharacterized membrane protein